MPIILLILCWPFIELSLLIKLGHNIGVFNTILYIFLSALLGIFILRFNGFTFVNNLNNALSKGESVSDAMLNGLLLFLGGVLLILPGILTDIVGLIFIFPLTRWLLCSLAGGIAKKILVANGGITIMYPKPKSNASQDQEAPLKKIDNDRIIDV